MSDHAALVGKTLNHYRVVGLLGRGGMGEVFVAEDTKLNRRVALKLLLPKLAGDPERRQRFAREAQAVASLNHPNIVTIHSVEESEAGHFITMELVAGRRLSDVVPGGGLPLDHFLRMAIPIADALSAAVSAVASGPRRSRAARSSPSSHSMATHGSPASVSPCPR